MIIWVVMGNDYPEAVFSNEETAEKFCQEKKLQGLGQAPKIYWRTYTFNLDEHSKKGES